MLKFKVLICDDREHKINMLIDILGKKNYQFDHVKNIKELKAKLDIYKDIDLLFLDLYYRSIVDDEEVPIKYDQIVEIKKTLKPKTKIIIYTEFTNRQIPLLRQLSFERIIHEWIDFKWLQDKLSIQQEILRIEKTVGLKSVRDELWVMHFSDLHFGKQFSFGKDNVGTQLKNLIMNQLKISSMNVDEEKKIKIPELTVFNGDFVQESKLDEFEDARKFLTDYEQGIQKLGGFRPSIVVAPGNHDLSWRISQCEERDVYLDKNKKSMSKNISEENDYKREIYEELKWMPFNKYMKKYLKTSTSSSEESRWWFYELSGSFKTNVIVINTSYKMTYKNNNVYIDAKLINEIQSEVEDFNLKNSILVSHHPVSKWGDSREQDELLSMLHYNLGVKLIFSGHKHYSKLIPHRVGSNNICEIQTGSTGSISDIKDTLEPPQYRILKISFDEHDRFKDVTSKTFYFKEGSYIPQVDADVNPNEKIDL